MGFKGRVIGLTGNIACGKSTVARLLGELGVPVVDADAVAREVTSRGAPALEAIVREFGQAVLDESGALDRKAMREVVFKDEARRKKLESILHPAIQARSRELISQHLKAGKPVVVYEAALLVETGRDREFDGLLVVTCDAETQKERLIERDSGMSAELAEQLAASQLSQDEKARRATWVIENNDSMLELQKKVRAWFERNIGRHN